MHFMRFFKTVVLSDNLVTGSQFTETRKNTVTKAVLNCVYIYLIVSTCLTEIGFSHAKNK